MKLFVLIPLFLFFYQATFGQVFDSLELKTALDRKYVFTSLRLALEKPNEVYKLKLRGLNERLRDIDDEVLLLQDSINTLRSSSRRVMGREKIIARWDAKI